MIKYNTIDIDIDFKNPYHGKAYLDRIVKLISMCQNCLGIKAEDSSSKGYHIFLWCKEDCELCRLVFDDSHRYMKDCERIEECRNIMFDTKHSQI